MTALRPVETHFGDDCNRADGFGIALLLISGRDAWDRKIRQRLSHAEIPNTAF